MRLIASVLGLLVIASGVAPAPHARAQRLVYIGTYTEKTASKGFTPFGSMTARARSRRSASSLRPPVRAS